MYEINAPLRRSQDVNRLVAAGAGSFYAGLMTANIPQTSTSLSHRQRDNANFTDVRDLIHAIELAHGLGVPVYLTMNARLLTTYDEPRFIQQLEVAESIGIDGIIVSNHYALLLVRERKPNLKVTASVNFGVMNAAAARSLAAYGVSRVILSRHLTVNEVVKLAEDVPEVEIEAFIINNKCAYHDAFCGYHYDLIETDMWPAEGCTSVADCRIPVEHPLACGACALADFAGKVAAVKVVGRELDPGNIERDIRFIAGIRDFVGTGGGERFVAQVRKAYQGAFGVPCSSTCYYEPEL